MQTITKINFKFPFKGFLFLAFVVTGLISDLQAQTIQRSSVSSAGSSSKTDGGTVRQTIGQPYGTNTSSDKDLTLRPGFQQPMKMKVELVNEKGMDLSVYPNPALRSVTIESKDVIENAVLQVSDLQGKLIYSENILDKKAAVLSCDGWSTGAYIITLTENGKNYKSSKLTITK